MAERVPETPAAARRMASITATTRPPPTYRRVGDVRPGSFAFGEPTEREIERREAMKAEE